jgi:hypothetical protein
MERTVGQDFVGDVAGSSYDNTDCRVQTMNSLPSWSWMVQGGRKIQFRDWGNNHFIIKHEGIAVDNTAVMSTPAEKVAALTSRSLTVSGRLCKILVGVILYLRYKSLRLDSKRERPPSGLWSRCVRDVTTDEKLGNIAFDFNPGDLGTCHVYSLLCIVRDKYGARHLTCSALALLKESLEDFEKIGLDVFTKKAWFDTLQVFMFDSDIRWRTHGREVPLSILGKIKAPIS